MDLSKIFKLIEAGCKNAGFQRLGGEGDQGVTASEYKIPFGVMKYSKLRSW